MTREEALDDIFWHRGISAVEHTAINTVDTVWLLRIDVQKYVTKIFNDHEAQLKAKEEADYKIGAWLSAALEDSSICDEFRKDIEFWFSFQKV